MIAASLYLLRTISSTIAASSIHGTGAQNLDNALCKGRTSVSGIVFRPNCSSRRRASSPASPVGATSTLGMGGEAGLFFGIPLVAAPIGDPATPTGFVSSVGVASFFWSMTD